MDIQTAKQIKIADYLHSLGFSPVKQQGINLWYKSPLREETEASFKVNTERNQWYDLHSARVGISSHWHRNFIVPTMCHFSCKESKNRHPVFVPYLFFWQAVIFRAKFSTTGDCAAFFSFPAHLLAGKGNKHCTGEKRMQ